MALSKPRVLAEGFVFPEGPRWHGGKLWFSDIHGRQVRTVDLRGKSAVVADLDDKPSGIGFLPDGTPLVTTMEGRKVLKLGPRGPSVYADLSRLPGTGINDMVVDGRGRAYVNLYGVSASPDGPADGIALVTPDGAARKVADGMRLPNGMMVTPDGRTLIAAETFGTRITAFDIGSDGSLSNKRLWADITPHRPDGCCLDAEGAVWAAAITDPAFIRVREGGKITDRIEMKDRLAVACMLGGKDRKTLFLLTNRMAYEDIMPVFGGQVDPRKVCHGAIEVVEVDVPGAGWP